MIELDLYRHCIETELKRLHNRYVAVLLRPGAAPAEAESKLQVLRKALDRLDFSRLRATFPELTGNHRDNIKLFEGQGDRLTLMINDNVIDLFQYYKS